jgi:Cu/Ag efflux pump CusA
MPTLDDAPTKQVATLTGINAGVATDVASRVHGDDLIQIYDVSEQVPKTLNLSELVLALQVAALDPA